MCARVKLSIVLLACVLLAIHGAHADDKRAPLQLVLDEFKVACSTAPPFYGAWIANWAPVVDADGKPTSYRIQIITDSSKASQKELIRQKLDELRAQHGLKEKIDICAFYELPLSSWWETLNRKLDVDDTLDDCHIVGGRFVNRKVKGVVDETTYHLELDGEIKDENQKAAIEKHCQQFLDPPPDIRFRPTVLCRDVKRSEQFVIVPWTSALIVRKPSPEEQLVQNEFKKACGNTPLLQGAWIKKWEHLPKTDGKPGFFRTEIITDSSKDSQKELIRQKLDELRGRHGLKEQIEICAFYEIPLGSWWETLNRILDADKTLNGCYVAGAHFFEGGVPGVADETYNLALLGRIADKNQKAAIEKYCGQFLARHAFDIRFQPTDSCRDAVRRQPVIAPWTKDLLVKKPLLARGQQLYVEGLNYYRQENFGLAYDTFNMAIIEFPTALEYRYWRIVSLLRMGDEKKAYDYMVALVYRREPGINLKRRVYYSLMCVQGTPRLRLIELETEALRDVFRWAQLQAQLAQAAPKVQPPAGK